MEFLLYLIIFTLGLIIGSFLNVCIGRIPLGQSIVTPPSHCEACGARLRPKDLIPVISWITLKGKCRYCGAKVAARYAVVELLTGAVFAATLYRIGTSLMLLPMLCLFSVLIVAAFIDMDHGIIPNGLILFGLIPGAFVALLSLNGPWYNGLLGMACGALPLLTINGISCLVLKKEGMGGGDMKLMGMAGLYLGWKLTLLSLLFGVWTGALAAAIMMAAKKWKRGMEIPFGPFLAAGAFFACLWGGQLLGWYISLFS